MKKILIALDYDPTAQQVAEKGHELAQALGAETVLLHMVADSNYYNSLQFSPIMGFGGFTDVNTLEMADTGVLKQAAMDFLEKTRTHLGDETITSIVEEGDSAPGIVRIATEIRADAIVLGSHSRRGLDKILMGSVSQNIMQHSSIPLYIIPTKKQ